MNGGILHAFTTCALDELGLPGIGIFRVVVSYSSDQEIPTCETELFPQSSQELTTSPCFKAVQFAVVSHFVLFLFPITKSHLGPEFLHGI